MPPSGQRDLAKEHYWRRVIQEWRRVIQKRDAESAAAQRKSNNSGSRRAKTVRKIQNAKQSQAHFMPARIIDCATAEPADVSAQSKVEVVLPCGTVLRITPDCSSVFLASVLTVLENRAC